MAKLTQTKSVSKPVAKTIKKKPTTKPNTLRKKPTRSPKTSTIKLEATCRNCKASQYTIIKKKDRKDMIKYYLICSNCKKDYIHIVLK
jgi:hypothetical protein